MNHSISIAGTVADLPSLLELAGGLPAHLPLHLRFLDVQMVVHRQRIIRLSLGAPRSLRLGGVSLTLGVPTLPLRVSLWLLAVECIARREIHFSGATMPEPPAHDESMSITESMLEASTFIDSCVAVEDRHESIAL